MYLCKLKQTALLQGRDGGCTAGSRGHSQGVSGQDFIQDGQPDLTGGYIDQVKKSESSSAKFSRQIQSPAGVKVEKSAGGKTAY